MRKKKQLYLAIIFTLAIVIGVGYAFLTSNLLITGNTTIKDNTWDIHFENFSTTTGSVTATSAGIDSNDTTRVNYTVTLEKPGDFYEFTVDAVNAGSLDAMVDTVSNTGLTQAQQNYITYSAKYVDGVDVAADQLLAHGESEKLKVRVEFIKDIANENLPSTDQAITLTFTINYKQADDSAVPVRELAVCKRATTLHKPFASNDFTYGNLGSGNTINPGDAFDCDVNGDGTYDASTERFYYVSPLDTNSNYAVLIYYSNISGSTPDNNATVKYDANAVSGQPYNGPITAKTLLPTTAQWKNVSLASTTRNIKDEQGTVRVNNFSYEGYAARLLTYQEVVSACGTGTPTTSGYLQNCDYLREDWQKSNINNYHLENVDSVTVKGSFYLDYSGQKIYKGDTTVLYGVRPVIEVPLSKIQK